MSAPYAVHGEDDEAIAAMADTVRRFAEREIAPYVTTWDEAGEFPRALYTQAASLGLLGLGYPEALGGTPASWRLRNAVTLALCRHGGSGGVMAGLFSHNIALPPVLRHGSPELQREVITPVLRGEKIAALAITEPGGGSDVAALRTTARRDGGDYVIEGEKVFITSGMRADFLTVAARTVRPKAPPAFPCWWCRAMRRACRAALCKKWAGGVRTRRSFVLIMCVFRLVT